ncbi:hypothetical protein CSC76_09210 [Pseudoxanthomonas mexicana]|jgi:hypothetical protein|uniref:hypothetical protein n=1 Tax=Pseudoxanthomonas mexicana TaxID=128785 RepID=UPI001389BAD4|nr:hypothetical protein [Pseudoxanthomonas mexicana]KAF1727755.1 hypothetical protein CSC76_09210 [Pseudoxanthomonas mexicana]
MSPAETQALADAVAEAVYAGMLAAAVVGVVAFIVTEKFVDLLTLHVPRWIRALRRARGAA